MPPNVERQRPSTSLRGLTGLLAALAFAACVKPALKLEVAANPNNVLSAVATISSPARLESLSITAVSGSGVRQTTPVLQVSGEPQPIIFPVLPLKATTTYQLTATAEDSTGETLESDEVTFSTGGLPRGVPTFLETDGGMPSPGYTLVAALPLAGTPTPDYLTIMDGSGAPVWYYGATPGLGGDFQQQPDGTFTVAVDDPTHVITGLEESIALYRQIDVLGNTLHTWSAVDVPDATPPITVGGTDDHEIRLQPDGDALLFGFVEQTMDMSRYGGETNANVVGDVLERVTPSGGVKFSWNPFTHLNVKNIDPASGGVTGPVVDFTHGNAIDVMDDGNYLISLRNLSQILKIDSTTGDILWKLGGTDGQFTFKDDPLSRFSCQHGARELPNGDIILYDDGDGHSPQQSRAVEYKLDTTLMTATLEWSSEESPPVFTFILGFAQRLANGNTLITDGTQLHVEEVDPSGENVLWKVTDPTEDFGLYRAFRLDAIGPTAFR